jgi:hypothetical protein
MIRFKKSMSGYYFVDENQTFTKEEAEFIVKAIKEAKKKEKEEKASSKQFE